MLAHAGIRDRPCRRAARRPRTSSSSRRRPRRPSGVPEQAESATSAAHVVGSGPSRPPVRPDSARRGLLQPAGDRRCARRRAWRPPRARRTPGLRAANCSPAGWRRAHRCTPLRPRQTARESTSGRRGRSRRRPSHSAPPDRPGCDRRQVEPRSRHRPRSSETGRARRRIEVRQRQVDRRAGALHSRTIARDDAIPRRQIARRFVARMNASPAAFSRRAPSPRSASDSRKRGAPAQQDRRVKLDELDVGDARAGHRTPWRCRRRWPRTDWWSRETPVRRRRWPAASAAAIDAIVAVALDEAHALARPSHDRARRQRFLQTR